MADKNSPSSEREGAGTVGKALGVLDIVARLGHPARASEIRALSDLPKATVYRFLQTLTEQNLLNYDPDLRVYSLGVRLVRLAQVAWRNFQIAPVAQPHLSALASKIGLAVYLSKLDGGQCVSLERGTPGGRVGVLQDVDRIYPAYCTAVGKAMLACLTEDALDAALTQQSFHSLTEATITDAETMRTELEKTRARGYAIEDGEHVRGIIAIGVPVRTPGGRLIGGLGVHAPDRQTDLQQLQRHVPKLQECAVAIASDAADWSFPEADRHIEYRGEKT
ncbi:IclR family transcriptional regulator [Vannielia litorea]|uniref:IclR family transcriptional regulator n=1 Tax=Vannielia litorea TaxID=1217970 RepID=UPI0015882843|nr:IclR family transcriptional regulator [Vannielia litorea]